MSNIDIEYQELKKFRLNSSAMAGFIIGIATSVILLLADTFKDTKTVATILGYSEFLVVCLGLYFYTRIYTQKRGVFGVTFGHALGFQVIISLFASILLGITTYIVMFKLSPESYLQQYKTILATSQYGETSFEAFSKIYSDLESMPVLVVAYSMFATIIKWFVPALIISALVRNSNDPLQGFKQEYINKNEEEKE